jgi:hypothetical protein
MSVGTDSSVDGKRTRTARQDNSQSLTPGSPGYHADFPSIDEMIASSQSSRESKNDSSDASTTATPVAKRGRQKKTSSAPAHPELCCSCPPSQTCSLRSNCACMKAGRVCTRCDPATCSKCRNTLQNRQRLARAAEAKAAVEQEAHEKAEREAQAKWKKLIDVLGATPKSATKTPSKQSPSPPNPSNGLGNDSSAAKESDTPNESPPNKTNVESSNPSQVDGDKT